MLYKDEFGTIYAPDELPDDGRPLWEFPGKEDGDQDPIDSPYPFD